MILRSMWAKLSAAEPTATRRVFAYSAVYVRGQRVGYKSVHRVAAGEMLPTTSKLRLVQVKVQLVRLIRRTGVRPPAEQHLAVRPTAAQRAQELPKCVAFLGDSW